MKQCIKLVKTPNLVGALVHITAGKEFADTGTCMYSIEN